MKTALIMVLTFTPIFEISRVVIMYANVYEKGILSDGWLTGEIIFYWALWLLIIPVMRIRER